jgi:hypothetical protein
METWLLVLSITFFLLGLVFFGRVLKEGLVEGRLPPEGFTGGHGGGGHGGGWGGGGGWGHGGGGHGHHHGGGGWNSYGGGGGYGGWGGGWYGFPYGYYYPPLTQCYRDWWGNLICSLEPEYRYLPPWW